MAKGDKKYGRQKKSASAARYKAENRAGVRKEKNNAIAKINSKTKKVLKVPRGTARALRRKTEKPTIPPEVV
jgi:hypothetical protein